MKVNTITANSISSYHVRLNNKMYIYIRSGALLFFLCKVYISDVAKVSDFKRHENRIYKHNLPDVYTGLQLYLRIYRML